MDIALSPPENGPRNPRHGSPRHVAISQSRRHPKRHGQPELVQGCCTGSSREGGRLRACKHPLKTPAKQGVFSAKIVAHSFKRGLGIRMADYAHSGGHSHRHCPLTTPRLVAATFAAASLISGILPGRQRQREVLGIGEGLAEPFAPGKPRYVAAKQLVLAEPIATRPGNIVPNDAVGSGERRPADKFGNLKPLQQLRLDFVHELRAITFYGSPVALIAR